MLNWEAPFAKKRKTDIFDAQNQAKNIKVSTDVEKENLPGTSPLCEKRKEEEKSLPKTGTQPSTQADKVNNNNPKTNLISIKKEYSLYEKVSRPIKRWRVSERR